MKKIIILSGVCCLLMSASANAQLSINLGFGEPQPAYVEAPEYVSPAPIYPTYAYEGGRYHDRYDHHRHGPVRRGPPPRAHGRGPEAHGGPHRR